MPASETEADRGECLRNRESTAQFGLNLPPADVLSPQQFRVFELLGEGRSNKEIAKVLGLSVATAKVHVSAVLNKLNCTNRTQAALIAFQFRLTGLWRPIQRQAL